MTASLRFGRIAGIPVGASWSALLIALLIAWSLAGRLLPVEVPGLAPAAYWLAGAAGAGLFLGSLLAHEIGHALVARRAGLRVRGITLWLLGGVAQLEDEPASPRDELRVAIVGPAVSLALAVAFGLVAFALVLLGGPAVAVAIAAWLAVVNTVLPCSTCPAAPGRRASASRLLWRRHGSRVRARSLATRAGVHRCRLVAYGLLGTLTGWGTGPRGVAGRLLPGRGPPGARPGGSALEPSELRAGQVIPRPDDRPGLVHGRRLPAELRPAVAGGRPAPADLRRPPGRVVTAAALYAVPMDRRFHRPRRRRRYPHVGAGPGRSRPAGHRSGGPAGQRLTVAAVVDGGQLSA
jgi:hypothetical protein